MIDPAHPLITSRENPKVKQVIRLRDRRDRDREGLFLIEGYRELCRATQAEAQIVHLFICKELFLGKNEPQLIASIAKKAPVYCLEATVFKKISYRDRPDGLLAVARKQPRPLGTLTRASFLVMAEAIEKPGNLGTILRSCDATGVDALILCDACTDLYNPNVVRASVGTLFTVPVFEASTQEAIKWLKTHAITLVAATPQAEKLYTQTNLTGPVAIAVGTEQLGLSSDWMTQADQTVRIPMLGAADSLNVATATTLLLYEVLRQRGWRK